MSDLMARLRAQHGKSDGVARWMAANATDREFAAWCRYVLTVDVSTADWAEMRAILSPLDDSDKGRAQPSGLTQPEAEVLAIKKWEERKKAKKRR